MNICECGHKLASHNAGTAICSECGPDGCDDYAPQGSEIDKSRSTDVSINDLTVSILYPDNPNHVAGICMFATKAALKVAMDHPDERVAMCVKISREAALEWARTLLRLAGDGL